MPKYHDDTQKETLMYTIQMEKEYGYFKKSQYKNYKATGATPHISYDTSCTATDKWSLESVEKSELDNGKSF